MSEALNAFEARSAKEIIARRTALELKNGMVVNLALGFRRSFRSIYPPISV